MDKLNIPIENVGLVSDGYHTFNELYEHRITLYIALCKKIMKEDVDKNTLDNYVWKSKLHADGSEFEGWFILGIGQNAGKQITYHLPLKKWDDIDCDIVDKAPEWDKHTPEDVLRRIKNL